MRITDISFQFVNNVLLLLLLRLPEWLQNWIWKCPCVITINSIHEPPSVLLFPMKHFVSHNLTVRSLSQSNQKTQHKHMTQHSCTPVCVRFMCNIFAWLLLKLKYCIWARMRYNILHHLWLKHRNMHLFIIRLQCQNIKGTIYSEMKHQRIKNYINNASL